MANNRAQTKLSDAIQKTSDETARVQFEMTQEKVRFDTLSRYVT